MEQILSNVFIKSLQMDIAQYLSEPAKTICSNKCSTQTPAMRYFQHVYIDAVPIKEAVRDFAVYINHHVENGDFNADGKSFGYPALLPLSGERYVILFCAESNKTLEELKAKSEEGLAVDHDDQYGLFKELNPDYRATGEETTTFEVDIYKESGKWYTRRKLTTPHFEGYIFDNDAIIAFIEANIPEVKGCDYSYEVWQGHAMNKHLVKR